MGTLHPVAEAPPIQEAVEGAQENRIFYLDVTVRRHQPVNVTRGALASAADSAAVAGRRIAVHCSIGEGLLQSANLRALASMSLRNDASSSATLLPAPDRTGRARCLVKARDAAAVLPDAVTDNDG